MTETRADTPPPRAQARPSTAVAVLGAGRVAEAIGGAGRIPYVAVGSVDDLTGGGAGAGAYSAVVVVSHGMEHASQRTVQEYASARRTPWLPVSLDSGWITIGPLVRPPRPGCPLCVRRRQSRNRQDASARRLLRERLGSAPRETTDSMVPPMLAAAVARLVRGELDGLVRDELDVAPLVRSELDGARLVRGELDGVPEGADAARTDGAILRLSVLDGSARRHRFLADPWCPWCADLPPDTGAGAIPGDRPLPKDKASPGFRLSDLRGRDAELRGRYVDAETGLIGSVATGSVGGMPTAVARLAPGRVGHESQHGYGRAADYRSAGLTALAEALERSSGERPGGRRTAVHGSYEQLAADAIDPRTLGTHPEELYLLPDYPFVPFAPDQKTSWVWGYSFARAAPVLVPESAVYYGPPTGGGPRWMFESSNGCAAGSCLEEAILHGLLELAERDAFLMTWYARLPVPRVALDSAADRRIPLTEELLTRRYGYRVMVFSTMLEQRVPTFMTFAVNDTDPARPAMAFGAAAHLSPERAVLSTLWEITSLMEALGDGFDPDAVAPMVTDPLLVREMADHAALYTHPATRSRAGFLDTGGPPLSLGAVAARAGWPSHPDLSDDLRELTWRYLATGLDVIAVDTTSTEQAAGGFASAKVIVPGMLPMTFGHAFRRTEGLPRLLTVPRQLGYRDRDLRPDEINPHPHPFP